MVATPATGVSTNGGAQPNSAVASMKAAPPNRSNGSAPPISSSAFPNSARWATPLDMKTVERKGQPAARDPPSRNRPHGLQEAPTFRPTEDEFRDPMAYIRSISEKASKYGICKIIPPDNWNPEFAIDLERFHFGTRRQELHYVEGGNRTSHDYIEKLANFHKQYGTTLNRFPSVDKRPLDLYKLKKAVEVRGGFEKVCKDKKWAEIGRDLGYSGKIMSSLSTSLKNSYQRWLFPYEQYLATAKPGVYQQLDFDYGGSNSPSNGVSPMNRPPSQMMNNAEHMSGLSPHTPGLAPVMQASTALNGSIERPERPRPVLHTAPPPPSPQQHNIEHLPAQSIPSGFTSVNSGFAAVNNTSGFAAVNTPSGFVAVNSGPPPSVKREGTYDTLPPPLRAAHPSMPYGAMNGSSMPIHIQQYNGPNSIVNGSNPLKRTMSHGSINGESSSDGVNGDGENDSGRRSKRPKKDGTPMLMGGHTSSMRPSTPTGRSKSAQRRQGDKCENCGTSEDRPNIIVCDNCELGYHRSCLSPPLASFPEYDWHCPNCLVGTGDYGFQDGSIYSLRNFQEKANNFKDHYFAQKMPFDPISNAQKKPSEDDIEREFWRLVENQTESVEVEYGADIHSTTHGSGFPTIEKNPLSPYSRDPWNCNVLPFHEESLFRHIKSDISGMTVPWLYVGMVFSTFCWHNEDHYAYSANYQHFGSTKTWYGIPGKDAAAFEKAMKEALPELFETQPDLLFQLVTLLPPDQLRKAGVDVYALDQRAGQFVITYPQAYHAGFNHGFNFNEAVNFAPANWEPFGEAGVEKLQEFRRQPCFSHDELLLTAAASDTTIKTAKWLAPALERMRDRENRQKEDFITKHRTAAPHERCVFDSGKQSEGSECQLAVLVDNAVLLEDDYQCAYCKAFTYLSQFRCKHTGKISCMIHADVVDCCAETPEERLRGPNHTLTFRYQERELKNMVQKVVDKSRVPETWQAKLEALLEDESRPPLRSMHTLLTEGEKIPYALTGLDDLADFVKRCDGWVEEANLYLTRKQQNRGKNEKAWRRKSLKAGGKGDEKDAEPQLTLERMKELIEDGDQLGFQAPQIDALREKLVAINEWRSKVNTILTQGLASTAEELEALMEEGKGFIAAMPELSELERRHQSTQWQEDVNAAKENMQEKTLDECRELLARATELNVQTLHPDVMFLNDMCRQGDIWEQKANEVMSAEDVHYPQLESLHARVQEFKFPVNKETLAKMDVILAKNREAKMRIINLVSRSHDPDFRQRPMYVEARDIMKTVEDLNGKPHGTAELEKELKRHEDWMRKGKKLFGKANAPLHILEQHMKIVMDKNTACFDLKDTFRMPVEPSSRHASPVEGNDEFGGLGDDEKPIFCICRMPEAGLMIECEICHEWYHAKCLKLARGKVKETETFTCPICDWRVKIPRDAARPKLDDLQQWQEELPDLPFQPEEEELLNSIVDKAQAFRDFLTQYTNGNQLCRTSEEMPEMLFYLRKIEGAEVLLSYETNIFRQELHKWRPIAPNAPPIIDTSLSTRKPRPTKQQKLMKELGVEKPEDLPPHLRTKQYVRRKLTESFVTGPLLPKPSQGSPSASGSVRGGQGQLTDRSNTPVGLPRQASTGNPPANSAFENTFMPAPLGGASTPFGNTFGNVGNSSYQADTPSPMFSPTASQPPESLRDPMNPNPFSGGPEAAQRSHSRSLFEPGLGLDGEDDIRNGLAKISSPGPTHAELGPAAFSSPVTGEYDIFMGMGGPDPDTQETGPAAMEHEPSQASEELEAMQTMDDSGGVEGGNGEPGPEVSNTFDDFLNERD